MGRNLFLDTMKVGKVQRPTDDQKKCGDDKPDPSDVRLVRLRPSPLL